jgi:23S rRNA (adenine2503-C2)-methyltransferase
MKTHASFIVRFHCRSKFQTFNDTYRIMTTRQHILDLDRAALRTWLVDHQQQPFRADQILSSILQRRVVDFESMTELPKALRTLLAQEFDILRSTSVAHQTADDGTEKLLLQLHDKNRIECVLLRDGQRRSICISSQVGCAMGCVFCASGLDGVERNLTKGEIVEQIVALNALLPVDERISHIVMMGMGEPLANLDRVLPALEVARDSKLGFGISPRRITISTVGIPKAINRLAEENQPYQLAISLHAPNDVLRTKIVPVNKNIGIESIIEATEDYFKATGRRLTFEYVLLADINDSEQNAEELVRLLRGRVAMLNVIPYNPVPGLPYKTPSAKAIHRFREVLIDGGVNVMFRQRKGDAIQAACGQLRRKPELTVQISM